MSQKLEIIIFSRKNTAFTGRPELREHRYQAMAAKVLRGSLVILADNSVNQYGLERLAVRSLRD